MDHDRLQELFRFRRAGDRGGHESRWPGLCRAIGVREEQLLTLSPQPDALKRLADGET